MTRRPEVQPTSTTTVTALASKPPSSTWAKKVALNTLGGTWRMAASPATLSPQSGSQAATSSNSTPMTALAARPRQSSGRRTATDSCPVSTSINAAAWRTRRPPSYCDPSRKVMPSATGTVLRQLRLRRSISRSALRMKIAHLLSPPRKPR